MKTSLNKNRNKEIVQSKLNNQASTKNILQKYKEQITQRQSIEEEELLQGKFAPTQLMDKRKPIQQKAENKTGLPDKLKSGIESISGYSLDDVKVHYNSSSPSQLHAHAYAQGTDIHIAPGQEKHLPHEAWHVVQQKQGRVKPTMQMNGNVAVNDEPSLEKEADVMGEKAFQFVENGHAESVQRKNKLSGKE